MHFCRHWYNRIYLARNVMTRTASGLILMYMRACGFQGWTSFWNTIYMAPGYELHEALLRHERKHLEQMQRDGKLVAAGTSYDGTSYDFAVVRVQSGQLS